VRSTGGIVKHSRIRLEGTAENRRVDAHTIESVTTIRIAHTASYTFRLNVNEPHML
jgi:hypothetical protein